MRNIYVVLCGLSRSFNVQWSCQVMSAVLVSLPRLAPCKPATRVHVHVPCHSHPRSGRASTYNGCTAGCELVCLSVWTSVTLLDMLMCACQTACSLPTAWQGGCLSNQLFCCVTSLSAV